MKSAYELAMERLEKASGPTRKLTEEQRAAIAEIEKVHEANVAQTELSYEARLQGAATPEEAAAIQAELADRMQGFEERRDRDKDAIWNAD